MPFYEYIYENLRRNLVIWLFFKFGLNHFRIPYLQLSAAFDAYLNVLHGYDH